MHAKGKEKKKRKEVLTIVFPGMERGHRTAGELSNGHSSP